MDNYLSIFKLTSINQYNLLYNNWRFYVFTLFFVLGNLFLPWLVHTIPLGGLTFLPIYFFVLIGAYKFGWRVGVATAICSPLANHFLTGMPVATMLPSIFVKGIVLALIASYIAYITKKLSLINLGIIILSYQSIGMIFELVYTQSISKAFQDTIIGYPGLLIQLFVGFFVLYLLKDYNNRDKIKG